MMYFKQSLYISCLLTVFTLIACSSGQTSGNDAGDTSTVVADDKGQKGGQGKVQQLTVDKLKILREAGTELMLIDVRTSGEIAEGKIAGAIEIDYEGDNFERQIDALGKEKSYIVYCAVGGRSQKAAEMMVQKGFRNVFNLKGGYDAWIAKSEK